MAHSKVIKDLKVLQIVPQIKFGGVERGVLDTFRYLREKKINTFIFCEKINLDLVKSLELKFIYQTNNLSFKDFRNYFKLNTLLKKIIDENSINLIHISSRAPALMFYRQIKSLSGIKYITSFHNPYQGSFIKKYYNSFLLKGDLVLANSVFTKNYIIKNYESNRKIFSVPRGIDLNYFNPFNFKKNHRNKLRKKFNILQHETVILVPSRFSKWKGHSELISLFNHTDSLLLNNIKLVFFIDASADNKKKYILHLCKKVLSKKILFIPYTKNIAEVYSITDIVISNSLKPEGFGRTISEALAMNVIALGNNIGGVREQLYKFDRKLLYDAKNQLSFNKAFQYGLKLKNENNFNGRDYVKKYYSLNQMLEKTLDCYLNK